MRKQENGIKIDPSQNAADLSVRGRLDAVALILAAYVDESKGVQKRIEERFARYFMVFLNT